MSTHELSGKWCVVFLEQNEQEGQRQSRQPADVVHWKDDSIGVGRGGGRKGKCIRGRETGKKKKQSNSRLEAKRVEFRLSSG